jgi:hypothetical protein
MVPGEEMVLTFEWGRLTKVDPSDSRAARWLQHTQIAKAQAAGDLEWSRLAEIGVGMNPAVAHLTGNMLLDEKAAGTGHIALGTNAFMGGTVYSAIHCDMVTRQPTILVDGELVVERGKLRYSEASWHDRQSEVALEDSPLRSAVWVARSGVQARSIADGRLQRMLRPEPGRLSACFVGDSQTARFAGILYGLIPTEGNVVLIEELSKQANLDPDLTRRVLHVLNRYELIKVS